MITRIYAHNYKSLVNFEWRPPATSVLVGSNGAGKSGLIEILGLVQDLITFGKSATDVEFPLTRTRWLDESDQTIELEGTFDVERDVDGQTFADERFRYSLAFHVDGQRTSVREELKIADDVVYTSRDGEVSLFGDQAEPHTTFPYDRQRSFLAAIEPRADNGRITAFCRFVGSIWIIRPDPPRIRGVATKESEWLDRTLENFAQWYRVRVQDAPDAAERMRQTLQKRLPGFDTLRFDGASRSRELLTRFAFNGAKHELPFGSLSDGQRVLVALEGLLQFGVPNASVLCLDEVENYVAPGEIQPWFHDALDAMHAHRGQTIAISHHPEPINYLERWTGSFATRRR